VPDSLEIGRYRCGDTLGREVARGDVLEQRERQVRHAPCLQLIHQPRAVLRRKRRFYLKWLLNQNNLALKFTTQHLLDL
jgi:hypothetical protein